jgi:hypothetical protein
VGVASKKKCQHTHIYYEKKFSKLCVGWCPHTPLHASVPIELAYVLCKLDLRKYRPLTTAFDWGWYPLSKELAKLATLNVYSYYKIGSKLL